MREPSSTSAFVFSVRRSTPTVQAKDLLGWRGRGFGRQLGRFGSGVGAERAQRQARLFLEPIRGNLLQVANMRLKGGGGERRKRRGACRTSMRA